VTSVRPQQAGFLGQHGVDLGNAHAQVVVQEEDDGRIDVTGAGAHHQAFQRGQAHGGVDGLAVLDGADGAAVAQVAVDDVELFHRRFSAWRSSGDEAVAGAVGAVTTDAVLA
jgi:hypothetical protein